VSDWRGLPVLITGGTGFLGAALARRLLASGAQVTLLARSATKAAPLAALGAQVAVGDLTDVRAVHHAAAGAEIVFHVAALLGGSLEAQRRVNVEGTRHMLGAALAARARRFVHVSSIAVYGNVLPLRVDEDVPLAPGSSPYAVTKAAAEQVLREIEATHGLSAAIVRPGMIFGPGSNMWTANAFRLARLRPTPFLGDGAMPVPAVDVEDVVDLLLLAALHPAASGEVFNAVIDPAPGWREYIGAYSRLAGHEDWRALPVWPARVLAGLLLLGAPRYSVARDLTDMIGQVVGPSWFSAEKARHLLGWEARTTPAEGAARSAAWLREIGLLKEGH